MIDSRLAIVGSRNYPDPVEVAEFVLGLDKSIKIISGGAHGVDAWAANVAHFVAGMEVEVKWADWRNLGKRAGFIRNKEIVNACNWMVAFWDGVSKGTQHSIALAELVERHVIIKEKKKSD